ncbi:WD40 repeat domain-containing protein [Sodalinema gerasimenkoae]|uniref:WD40 repeat domain-containing protein n=1 Tax=Sodalinema gerasimenkoae TaxID=2862348 RepID=UPI001359B338|nr:WD40 repeat domain-containing protein [Sodalinema gerasimenkoae]
MRSPNQLEVAEYLCWVSAVIGTLVAAISSRIVFAGVPISLSLLLNLINRRRLEVMLNHQAMTALIQLQDQVCQEFDALYRDQPDLRMASQTSRPPSPPPLDISVSSSQGLAEQLQQLQGQYDQLHRTLADTIDYLNHSPVPQRLDGLEHRLSQVYQELSQLRQQWQTTIPIEVPIQVRDRSVEGEVSTPPVTREAAVDVSRETLKPGTSSVDLPFPTPRETPTVASSGPVTPPPVPTFSIERRSEKRDGVIEPSLPLEKGVVPTTPVPQPIRERSQTISHKINRPEPAAETLPEREPEPLRVTEVGLPEFQPAAEAQGLPQQVWHCVFTLEDCQDWISDLLITPDGELLIAASFDKTIPVWHLKTGALIGALTDHESPVCSLTLSQDGSLLASGSWDKTVKLWDIQGLRQFRPTAKKPWDGTLFLGDTLTDETEEAGSVRSLSMTPDGRFIVSSWFEAYLQVWQVRVSPKRRRMTTTLCDRALVDQGRVEAVRFTPDGRGLVSAGADGSIVLWSFNGETGQFTRDRLLTEMSVPVNAIAFAAGGTRLVSGSRDHMVRVWDLASGELQGLFEGHRGSVTTLTVCPDGDTVVSGSSDGTVKLWSLEQQGAIASFCDGGDAVMAVAVSPDGGAIVSGTADGTVKVWRRG